MSSLDSLYADLREIGILVQEMTVHDLARQRAMKLVNLVSPQGKKMPVLSKDEFFAKARKVGGEKFGEPSINLAWKVYNEIPLAKDESMVAWESKYDDKFDNPDKLKHRKRREREWAVIGRRERIQQFRDKKFSREGTDNNHTR